MEYPSLIIRVIQLILLSSLAVIAKDGGFITATDSEKEPVKVDGKKEEPTEEKKTDEGPPKLTKKEIAAFYASVEGYKFMDPKLIELAKLILMWDLKGADFDQDTHDEDTKWLVVYKKEMQAAEDNLDIGAYIFFFQEHVYLVIKRAGMSLEKK